MATADSYPQLGRYQVIDRIASGGMAEVFLAKATGAMGFQRLVALKLIHANFTRDEDFVKMFIDEARIAMHLNHRNIVQVFDLDKSSGAYFIAMEYVHGVNLYDLYERVAAHNRWIDASLALYLVAEICKGLHFAHTRKDAKGLPLTIIHRDISPQNILLSFEGEVKIADFGIATAAQRLHQTAAGIVKGKYAYMAPERLQEKPIDARVDVFSVGVLLYELLVGENPFAGGSAVETIDNVLQRPVPPPSSRGAATNRDLDEICLKALAKDPDERFDDAQTLSDVLTEYAMDLTVARKDMAAGDAAVAELLTRMFPERARRSVTPAAPGSLIIPGVEDNNDTRLTREPSVQIDFETDQDPLDRTTTDDDEFDVPTVLRMERLQDGPTPQGRLRADTEVPTRERGATLAGAMTEPTELPAGPAADPTIPSRIASTAPPSDPRPISAQTTPPPGLENPPAGSSTDMPPPSVVREGTPTTSRPRQTPPSSAAYERGHPGPSRPSQSTPTPNPGPPRGSDRPGRAPATGRPAATVRPHPGGGSRQILETGQPGGYSASGESFEAIVKPVRAWRLPSPRQLNILAVSMLTIAFAVATAALAISRGMHLPRSTELQLTVRTQPAGAEVTIDGRRLDRTTPLEERVVTDRPLRLKITLAGFEPVVRQIIPEAGNSAMVIDETLQAVEGQLTVLASPDKAEVLIDGQRRGAGRVQVDSLPLGQPIEVRVQLDGYGTFRQAIELTASNPHQTLAVPLAPKKRRSRPRPRPATRKVMLTAPYGSWATVYYEGQALGSTPTEATLPVGTVKVRIRNDEIRLNREVSIEVPRSGPAEIQLPL